VLALAGAASASPYRNAAEAVTLVLPGGDAAAVFRGCVRVASRVNGVPPAVLLMLLQLEGGRLGEVSGNRNGTVDIGPFQVNEMWLPAVARHWGMPAAQAFPILRDNFCGNADAAAWILRGALADAHGDVWEGVGRYHSARSDLQAAYLRRVLAAARRLRAGQNRG